MKRFSGNSDPRIKSLLFTLILLFLVMPAIQGKFGLIANQKLSGAFTESEKPSFKEFTWRSWFEGSFQEVYNKRLEQHIGFRNPLVRINNQLNYSIFRQANAEGVIVGQHNQLFEEDYIKEHFGLFFVGDTIWSKKAIQLKAVQDTLAKLGKTLVVIFEPGKADFFAEALPAQYRNTPKTISNYAAFRSDLDKAQVNVLDLNQYFISIKDKAEYPLFLQTGTHWSYYGAALAADTTLRYLEALRGIDLPDMKIIRTEELQEPRYPDNDIGLTMNLLFNLPQPKTGNPIIRFQHSPAKTKSNALIIGDSFYFNWLNNHIPEEAFSSCDFWYYNKNITHSDGSAGGVATALDLRNEVMKRDIILIMITGRFMHSFAWEFDEQLYDLYYPGYRDPVEFFSNKIRTYGDEFQRMYKESMAMNISLPDRIQQEARYLFYEDTKKFPDKYTAKRDILLSYEMGIRGTAEWMKEIERKANINKISVDKQIRLDAEWIYNDKFEKNK